MRDACEAANKLLGRNIDCEAEIQQKITHSIKDLKRDNTVSNYHINYAIDEQHPSINDTWTGTICWKNVKTMKITAKDFDTPSFNGGNVCVQCDGVCKFTSQ